MKTIGFIGAYDKIDLLEYIAKLLTAINKKVLIIDTTILQRAKYIVPVISPAKSYITSFEGIDIAVGLYSYTAIKNYLGIPEHAALDYDYIFVDIDSIDGATSFDINTFDKNYFVSGLDAYSLRRGLEVLTEINEPLKLKKILFSRNMSYDEEEYFNYLALGVRVTWDDETIYFQLEVENQAAIIENQMVQRIKFRRLTELYKKNLLYITDELLDNKNESADLKRAFKQLEKGV